jgi:hypothetical protein
LAHVRGIKDTSRQGRWHNARFKALAEELGIEVTKDPRIGWSPTNLPAETRAVRGDDRRVGAGAAPDPLGRDRPRQGEVEAYDYDYARSGPGASPVPLA